MGRSLTGARAAALARSMPGFRAIAADATEPDAVRRAIGGIEDDGPLDVVVYNAAALATGPFEDLTAETFEQVWRASCFGAMVVAQAALGPMVRRGRGTLLFTGATASLRGGAQFAAFASAKFALRGLVQSLSRAYWPRGVHVAHVVIDGLIGDGIGKMRPDEIAQSYVALVRQPRSAWTQELDLRPQWETF
jgi:NAD(P)-dependent dehydrogenase (short-subunit alcohol dehydrogenase family)